MYKTKPQTSVNTLTKLWGVSLMNFPSLDGTHGSVKNVFVIHSCSVMVSTGSFLKQSRIASSFGQPTDLKKMSERLRKKTHCGASKDRESSI